MYGAAEEIQGCVEETYEDSHMEVALDRFTTLEARFDAEVAEILLGRAMRQGSLYVAQQDVIELNSKLTGADAGTTMELKSLIGGKVGETLDTPVVVFEKHCESTVPGQESAVSAVFDIIAVVCKTHREQTHNVIEGMTGLGKGVNYRIERLEADFAAQRQWLDDIEQHIVSAAKLEMINKMGEVLEKHDKAINKLTEEVHNQGKRLSAEIAKVLQMHIQDICAHAEAMSEKTQRISSEVNEVQQQLQQNEIVVSVIQQYLNNKSDLGSTPSANVAEPVPPRGVPHRSGQRKDKAEDWPHNEKPSFGWTGFSANETEPDAPSQTNSLCLNPQMSPCGSPHYDTDFSYPRPLPQENSGRPPHVLPSPTSRPAPQQAPTRNKEIVRNRSVPPSRAGMRGMPQQLDAKNLVRPSFSAVCLPLGNGFADSHCSVMKEVNGLSTGQVDGPHSSRRGDAPRPLPQGKEGTSNVGKHTHRTKVANSPENLRVVASGSVPAVHADAPIAFAPQGPNTNALSPGEPNGGQVVNASRNMQASPSAHRPVLPHLVRRD